VTSRWTWHGGGLTAARGHFGGDDWLDLSTGINPHSWPGTVAIDWRHLPDEHSLRELEAAAAGHFGCDPDHVCAVPGTEAGLRLIGRMLPAPAFHLTPGYRTHGELVDRSTPISVEGLDEADGSTLILANPNNPDGRLLDRSALLDLLDRRGAENWLLLDEAFADCHPEQSLAADARDGRQLLVFRSFGKFFGLAGLRLGFVIGPRGMIEGLRRRLGAWPVSAAAIAIGIAAYSDTDWITAMRARLRREANELDAILRAAGFDPQGGCPLFRLIDCGDGMALFERLARRAILTRPFDHNPGWLRLGLPGGAKALDRVQSALADG
jgi:cobalamin biosynthetic protein CobC